MCEISQQEKGSTISFDRNTVIREHKQEKNRDPSTYKTNQPKRIKMKTLVKEGAQVSSIELKKMKRVGDKCASKWLKYWIFGGVDNGQVV